MPIRSLDPAVASQIAAGEVIERPASVIKELIENALDAQATTIQITIEGAGQRLMEVADDGQGIPAAELPLAVARHATSKLAQAEDLFHLHTLGFRGEALASIGSVARLTLTSRPPEAAAAAELRVAGGAVAPVEVVGAAVGTSVRVEDLFYNVPARLKFLKQEATERRAIDGLVTRYALAYPQVRFRVTQEGRPSLQTSGAGDRREVLAALFGVETARQMLEVIADDGALQVGGFISPLAITRSHRRDLTFFVNGRPVQDAALISALLKGYHTYLMVGRYPVATLFVTMPPESVDVNVHPTKAEVRFRQSEQIFTGVQHAVRRALLAYAPTPGLETEARPPSGFAGGSAPARQFDLAWGAAGEIALAPPEAPTPLTPTAFPADPAAAAAPTVPAANILRLVGQIAATYLVAEGPDGLYLIDQHAAHERVLFERLLAAPQDLPAQTLLQPVSVALPPAQARLVEAALPALSRYGFQIDGFGPNTFLVRAIPALLRGLDPAAALQVLVEDFEEDESPLQAESEARLIARVCKRAAVKAGQTLSPVEQEALLRDLAACQAPRTCPHGRPTMIHLSVDLLARQFGRKGAR